MYNIIIIIINIAKFKCNNLNGLYYKTIVVHLCFNRSWLAPKPLTYTRPLLKFTQRQKVSTSDALHALLHSSFSHLPTDAVNAQYTTENP